MTISRWGVYSIVLMVAGLAVGAVFAFWLYDQKNYHLLVCVLLELEAAVTSGIAVRRGSAWWLAVTVCSGCLAAQGAVALFIE